MLRKVFFLLADSQLSIENDYHVCDWLTLFAEQLALAHFLDFGLFHDTFETLKTDVFDQLGQEIAVFSQLEQDLVVVWCADLGAFLEDFPGFLEQFTCTFGHVLFPICLIIDLALQSTLLQRVVHK